jgi:hypothetical protein
MVNHPRPTRLEAIPTETPQGTPGRRRIQMDFTRDRPLPSEKRQKIATRAEHILPARETDISF